MAILPSATRDTPSKKKRGFERAGNEGRWRDCQDSALGVYEVGMSCNARLFTSDGRCSVR